MTLSNIVYSQNKYDVKIINNETFISNTENKKEYLFQRVAILKCDSKGDVYVVDYHGTEIRKYTKDGLYLKTIGRVGYGPGEFKSIESLDFDKNDNLIVWDVMSRRISILTKDGKLLSSQNTTGDAQGIYYAWNYPNSRLLTMRFPATNEQNNIFYIYNYDMNKSIANFGHPSVLFNMNDDAFDEVKSCINIYVNKKGDVYATRQYYDGRLFKFESANNWQHKVYKGNEIQYKDYIVDTDKNNLKERVPNSVIYEISKNKMKARLIVRTVSLGLFNYKNKYLVNFVYQGNNKSRKDGGKSELGIELFGFDGNYLGYYVLPKENVSLLSIGSKVLCMDNEGSFYMLDIDANLKIMIVKKLTIDIKEIK